MQVVENQLKSCQSKRKEKSLSSLAWFGSVFKCQPFCRRGGGAKRPTLAWIGFSQRCGDHALRVIHPQSIDDFRTSVRVGPGCEGKMALDSYMRPKEGNRTMNCGVLRSLPFQKLAKEYLEMSLSKELNAV